MSFVDLRARYEEKRKASARQSLARGKRRFVVICASTWAAVFWLAMNAFQFLRHPDVMSGGYLARVEILDLFMSMLVGFSISMKAWSNYQRIVESE